LIELVAGVDPAKREAERALDVAQDDALERLNAMVADIVR
jgi:hypothetical protein